MKFQYVAYTTHHGVIKGEIEAPNETEATAAIALQGYKALSVDPVRRLPQLEEIFPPPVVPRAVTEIGWTSYLIPSISSGKESETLMEAKSTSDVEAMVDNIAIRLSTDTYPNFCRNFSNFR